MDFFSCLGSAEVVDAVDLFFFLWVLFQQITNSLLSASVHCTDLHRNFSKSMAILDFPLQGHGKTGRRCKGVAPDGRAWVQVCIFTRYPTCCDFFRRLQDSFSKSPPKKQNQSFFFCIQHFSQHQWFFKYPQHLEVCVTKRPPTWRVIPVSKWLITMVIVSPQGPGVVSPSKRPKWLINRSYCTSWYVV